MRFKQKQPVVQTAINNALSGGGGGGGGTTDYTELENKPSINSVTLSGNKTTSDLGIDEVPTVTSSDNGKILTASYSGGVGSCAWSPFGGLELVAEFTNSVRDTTKYYVGTNANGTYDTDSPYILPLNENHLYVYFVQKGSTQGGTANSTGSIGMGLINSQNIPYTSGVEAGALCDTYSTAFTGNSTPASLAEKTITYSTNPSTAGKYYGVASPNIANGYATVQIYKVI